MASGGSRLISGPAPSPYSERSEKRNLQFLEIEDAPYVGDIPTYTPVEFRVYSNDKQNKLNEALTREFLDRELQVWAELWSLPQANLWAKMPWLLHSLFDYTRLKTSLEFFPLDNASFYTKLENLKDELGLSIKGLQRNNWLIVSKKEEPKNITVQENTKRPRLKLVSDD